jgi:hypothetical protein
MNAEVAEGDFALGPVEARLSLSAAAPPLPVAGSSPSLSDLKPIPEPWFYVFLDRYATIATKAVVFGSFAVLALGILFYLFQLYVVLSVEYRLGSRLGTLLWSSGLITLWFLAGLAAFLLLFVVPVLFALALIHVVVDAARNLRVIGVSLAKG